MRSVGLVDLQVNGFGGVDFNAGPGLTGADIDVAMEALLAAGVTMLLPTVITAGEADLAARLVALDRAISASALGAAMCPGFHLEGPFLNPAPGYAGCHPPDCMTAPDAALVERLQALLSRPILLVTLAPELAGAEAFIRQMRARGRLVAIGHSAVDDADVARAVAAGASLSTHLGNGLPQVLPKLVNPIMAQLAADGLSPCFIADGIHVPRPALKAMIRAAQGRAMLVSDAVSAAASPPGLYPFAGMTVRRDAEGAVRLPDRPTLAGSGLCLDQAVRNVVAWGIVGAEEALAMASTRPAAHLAPALAAHGLAPLAGELVWSDDLRLRELRLGGLLRRFTPSMETPDVI